jgi:hypothetical protein
MKKRLAPHLDEQHEGGEDFVFVVQEPRERRSSGDEDAEV